MADADGTEENQVEDLDEDEDESLIHLTRIVEARRALPWGQWSFREKVNYYMDRIILVILVLFLLMLIGEVSYFCSHLIDVKKFTAFVKKFAAFVSGSVVRLVGWFVTQEEQEERIEL